MQKLIVIDGLDGSGKATQAKLLAERLRERHLHVREVSFPNYDSPSSSLVKMYLAGEFGSRPDDVNAYAASSFYAVDRYTSFQKDWRSDWEKGIVVADRYTTSNAIHQCSKLPDYPWTRFLDWLFEYEYVRLGIPAPSTVIYQTRRKTPAFRHWDIRRTLFPRFLCRGQPDNCGFCMG